MRENITLNIKELVLLKTYPEDYFKRLLTKSYSHKPYLADMPYDRNTRHPLKMCARYIALGEYEQELKDEIKSIDNEFTDALADYDNSKKELIKANNELKETDQQIQKEKERLGEIALDRLFLDGGVALYDDAFAQFDTLGENDDWVTNWENSPSYQYFDSNWVEPLQNILSFTGKTGYCDKVHSDMIDDYIERLEALDIQKQDESWSGWVRREEGIEYLRQIQDNQKFNDAEAQLEDAKKNVVDSRKKMSDIKRKNHEKNVELYEIANEKLNCSDIFDEAQLNGNSSNPLPNIEEYSNMINIYPNLNRDGTVDKIFLESWESRNTEYMGA